MIPVSSNTCVLGFHVIADASAGNVDLTAISGQPNFAPNKVLLSNDTAAALSVVLTPAAAHPDQPAVSNKTVSVPAQSTIKVPHPISAVVASGSGAVQLTLFWYGNPASVRYNS